MPEFIYGNYKKHHIIQVLPEFNAYISVFIVEYTFFYFRRKYL